MFPIGTFLISVGAISALSAVLALLMVIADATIANYGEVQLKINDDKEFTVQGGRPLLSTLMGESIFIPSACGGRGSCGLCKLKIESGVGAYLPTELPWISEEEKKENIRLSCQVKVKTDMTIRIPEELFNVKEYKARVTRIRELTYDIKEVYMELLEPSSISFRAGQFIQFKVPEYDLTDEPVYRAYSMSSAPSDTGNVEIEVRLVPNGICTTYVHQYLKEGDTVTINGPYGEFFLRDSERNIVFVAGGSGNAPIKAILSSMIEKGINRKATYFFGARSKRDLFLVEEMRELEKKLPQFTYVPALSEPLPEDKWEGETGLITDVLSRFMKSGDNVEAYLCGSPGMINACIKVFQDKGVPENLIYFDKFA